ncbi:MAG: hypothetical protein PHN81_05075 [Actinomycetota bacterium]|nr:hypothetical protein [Actinomycetota bacterium]
MKKSINRTLIGLGIFIGIIIVAAIVIFISMFIGAGISVIREKSTSGTKYVGETIVKNYPPGTSDWAGGSFIAEIVWKDDPLWKEEYIWRDDSFWEDEFWDLIYNVPFKN